MQISWPTPCVSAGREQSHKHGELVIALPQKPSRAGEAPESERKKQR